MMTTASLPCRAGLALGLALAASTIASAKGLSGHLHGSEWGFVGDPAGAERFVQFTGGKRLVGSGGCNATHLELVLKDADGKVLATLRRRDPD